MVAAAAAPRSRPDPAHPSGVPPGAPVFAAVRAGFFLIARRPPAAPFPVPPSFVVRLRVLPCRHFGGQKKY